MEAAAFRQLPGSTERPAEAWRVRAADGVGLRIGLWRAADPSGARGTILLFNGRSEYLEKYAPVAARLTGAGWNVLGVDWRGQGASDRLLDDPRPGHVGDFADYQRDVAALVAAGEALGVPRPWHLLAHSMGGCIGLRALADGLPVASVVFSAPMWGIAFGRMPDGIGAGMAGSLAHAAGRTGRGPRPVPGPSGVLDVAFARNALTGDLEAWIRFLREAAAWPELTLGAATYDWVRAALGELRSLRRLPSPALPALIGLPGDEAIVSPIAMRRRAAAWPDARLMPLPGARHEPLFEAEPIRSAFTKAVLDHFAANTT